MRTEEYERQDLDRTLRGLHATAARQLSPTTLARLRDARHGLTGQSRGRPVMGTWHWMAAGLGSIAVAVVFGLQMAPPAPGTAGPSASSLATTTAPTGALDYPASLAALDEDPDLYLWLAAEAGPLQLEQL